MSKDVTYFAFDIDEGGEGTGWDLIGEYDSIKEMLKGVKKYVKTLDPDDVEGGAHNIKYLVSKYDNGSLHDIDIEPEHTKKFKVSI